MSATRRKAQKVKHSNIWKPHKYQTRCVMLGLVKKHLAYFLDPGLGKTTIILKLFSILKKAGLVKAMLVVAPLRPCYMVWPKEVKKWSAFKNLKVTVLHGESATGKKFIPGTDIYVINPEGLPWLLAQLKGKRQENWPFDMLVVDESTKFKNMSTSRFKNLKHIIPKMKRRYILTGTPIPNGLANIQGQMAIVDMGESLGLKKKDFRENYFKTKGDPKWQQYIPRSEEHADMIYKKVSKFSVRLKAEDYLDVPSRVNNPILIKLPKKTMASYNELEKTMFTIVDGEIEINAETQASVNMKCHQFANGRIYENEDLLDAKVKKADRKIAIIHEHKLDALEDLIEELDGKPLLIAYYFNHDLEALKSRFKTLHTMESGVSIKHCLQVEKDWNAGKIQLLAAQPSTSSLGLNLQEQGQDVAWYSLIHDLEAFDQFVKRIERQGSKHDVIRNHVLLAEDTVDEVIWRRLQGKHGTQLSFLKAVEVYARNKYHSGL